MSFLQNIQIRKASLKQTDTFITCADGRRFIERHSSENLIPISPKDFGFIVDTSPDEIPAKVLPNLFIGAQDCCSSLPLSKNNINFVLSVGIHPPCILENIQYEFIECLDLPETNLLPIILQCNEIIKKCLSEEKNILVHCNAGVSRSSAVVLGFLIKELNFTFDDAYGLLKSARPAIQPNIGFVTQLKNLKYVKK